MNDTETNPQRHGAPDDGEPSHRSADASRESLPARDAADNSADLRSEATSKSGPSAGSGSTAQFPPAAPGAEPGGPQPGVWHGPADATSGSAMSAAHAAAPASAAPASAASGWQSGQPPYQPHLLQPHIAQAAHPHPFSQAAREAGAAYQAGQYGPYQPTHQGAAQHPQPGHPQPGQPQPGQPQLGQPQPGQPQPGQPGYGGADADVPGQLPPWATQATAEPPRPGRGRKFVLTGVAALLLMVGSGGVGALAAIEWGGNGSATTVQTNSAAVNRVVDRSSLSLIAKAVQPSVVSITTGTGEGSGVVISDKGYILTNNHVVASAQGDTVKVAFSDGKTATAKIVGTDPRTDLAVVQVSGVPNLKVLAFGDSDNMEVGDTVLALGSPLGLEGSVTAGIISAKNRTIQASDQGQPNNPFGQQQQQPVTSISGMLQTDASINPGNSGGALVNTESELIGINSAIATSGQSTGNIGVGFAIPSNKAKAVAEALMNGRKVTHPQLGVGLSTSSDGNGAVITNVNPGSPAAQAGLQANDVIIQVDGKPVADSDDVISAVQAGTVGQKITLTYTRNGQQATATPTLADAG